MADVEHEPIGTRKGFSFTRTPRAGVLVRVRTSGAGVPIPTYREVELTAVEWIDVICAVSASGGEVGVTSQQALDLIELHMGPMAESGL